MFIGPTKIAMLEVNLLHIDKSKIARNLLAKGLDSIANITGVGSLAEARQEIAKGSHNFIILDYELPDGDGLTFAEEVRKHPDHAKTPIILYTASLNNELEYRAMQAGINEGLHKPVDMFEMMQHVVKQIELPHVKRIQRQLLQLTCFSWKADGKYHEYSPDLNLLLTGDNLHELRQQMHGELEEQVLAKDDPSKYPAEIEMYKHVITLPPKNEQAA